MQLRAGGATIPNTGSSGLAITPPVAWNYSSDNPTLAGANTAPVAVTDNISVGKGETSTVLVGGGTSVLTNDTDIDGNALTAILVSNVTNGSLTLNSNGTFSYTHNNGVSTTDSFTYKVNDGFVDGNTVTVNITVTPPNNPPVVSSTQLSELQYQINATDVNGDTLSYSVLTQGTYGTVSVTGTGLVTYIAGGGFTGRDSFSIAVSDGISNTPTVVNIGAAVSINLSSIFVQSESPKYDGSYYNLDRS